MPQLHLTFSLYWLLVPIILAVVAFVAYKLRELGSGPGDALYGCIIISGALFVVLVCLLVFMAVHIFNL